MPKTAHILSCIAILAACLPCRMAAASAPASTTDVRPEFIQRLKAVADDGDLFDPSSIAPMLDMGLRTETSEQMEKCSGQAGQTRRQTTMALPGDSSWYRPLPTGVGDMEIPAAFVNPASKAGIARLDYKIEHKLDCDRGYELTDSTKAQLLFAGLPSYACFTPADIRKLFPEAKFEMATDGVSSFRYRGRVDDDAATSIEFLFRMGAPCAIAADVSKDQSQGWRAERARIKRMQCIDKASRAFCAAHGPISWSDGDAVAAMQRNYLSSCESIAALVAKDREPGTPPPPPPPRAGGSFNGPCPAPGPAAP